MSIKKFSMMLLSAMSLAALLNGCGSSSKEGDNSPGGVARVSDESVCRVCHSSSIDPVSGTLIVSDFVGTPTTGSIASVHFIETRVGCEGCHGGGAQHNGVGPIPFPNPLTANRCITCHTVGGLAPPTLSAGGDLTPLFELAKAGWVVNGCANCHTASRVGSVHGAMVPTTNDCISCHDVAAPQHGAGLVGDNNGVRAITTEFGKWSHHVTGVTLNSAHCAACHLEGTASNGAIVVDPAFHMVDNMTHLRNSDDDTDFAWNSAAPNHTSMDNFCMSCHDANGASSQGSKAVQAVINAIPLGTGRSGTASALNPFGDTISNQYDQLSRGAVVAVKEQFDTGNTSHHGVGVAKYTKKNLVQTELDAIAAANLANGDVVPAVASATVGTLYETGKFTAYKPFGSATVLADDSVIHCADCHTVGQFKPNTTNIVNDDGTLGAAVATVIGAHGSNNEYMLRNQDGSDATTNAKTAMVCYICHTSNQYDGYTINATSHNQSMNHSNSATITKYTATDVNCNGNGNNTMGATGRVSRVGISDANYALMQSGKYGTAGSSNPFANKCINCHNAGVDKNFGGIHGNAIRVGTTAVVNKNVSYYSYSGANGATPSAPLALTVIARKPYRFLPGLGNFRYNGGTDSNAWTRKSIGTAGKSERMGCYTLNGASSKRVEGFTDGGLFGSDYISSAAPTKAIISGVNVSNTAIATDQSRLIDGASSDTGILGSWGGCAHHAGNSAGATTGLTRTSIRPLTY